MPPDTAPRMPPPSTARAIRAPAGRARRAASTGCVAPGAVIRGTVSRGIGAIASPATRKCGTLQCVFQVLICDDAVAFPDLFAAWMEDCDGVDLAGTARNPQEAAELSRELQPDVIVLDHLLREETSADLAPRLRDVAPEAKVLLISGMPQEALSGYAREAGADAHVSKALSAQDICSAVVELGGG